MGGPGDCTHLVSVRVLLLPLACSSREGWNQGTGGDLSGAPVLPPEAEQGGCLREPAGDQLRFCILKVPLLLLLSGTAYLRGWEGRGTGAAARGEESGKRHPEQHPSPCAGTWEMTDRKKRSGIARHWDALCWLWPSAWLCES